MVGRTIYNLKACLMMALMLLFPATVGGGQGPGWLAVLLSDSEESYEAPVNAFIDSVPLEVRVFNLHGGIHHDPGIRSPMFEDYPGMIFSLGAKAASMAKDILARCQSPQSVGVMEPLGTNVYVNRDTAERIGIKLSDQITGMATEVIETRAFYKLSFGEFNSLCFVNEEIMTKHILTALLIVLALVMPISVYTVEQEWQVLMARDQLSLL